MYTYKIVTGAYICVKHRLFRWGDYSWKHLEDQINDLVEDGWEVESSSTAASGWAPTLTTFVLRKPKAA